MTAAASTPPAASAPSSRRAWNCWSDGIAPAIIDNVGRATGMPRGPLEMHDDVALDLSLQSSRPRRSKDLGDAFTCPTRCDALIIATMVTELEPPTAARTAKVSTTTPPTAPKSLWPGLADLATGQPHGNRRCRT